MVGFPSKKHTNKPKIIITATTKTTMTGKKCPECVSQVLNIEILLIKILKDIDTKNLFSNRRVCKFWYKLCCDVNIWFNGILFESLSKSHSFHSKT